MVSARQNSPLTSLEEAYAADDSNPYLAKNLGLALIAVNRHEDAIAPLEYAIEELPDDFFLFYKLGIAFQATKRPQQALRALETALELVKPGSANAISIQHSIRLVQEDLFHTDGPGRTVENERFIIRFVGDSHAILEGLTIDVLDDVYHQVTQDLGFRPTEKTEVIFFRTSEFHTANKAQDWVGGLAAGTKIMVPLQGGYQDLSLVKGLFAHELTHVVINAQTGNQCPLWVHEGLATYQELQAEHGDPLQPRHDHCRLFAWLQSPQGRFPALDAIEFHKSDPKSDDIMLGYLCSYLGIRYLIEHFGKSVIPELLNGIREGIGVSAVLQRISGKDLPAFQTAVQTWIQGL